MSRPVIRNALLVALVATAAALASAEPLLAQAGGLLTPGDVVRIDNDFVGTLMSIDESTLTIIGEGKPTCWPGIRHGEAPRCDPAPSVRRVIDWRGTTVERQLVERSYTKNVVLGFLIGAVAAGPIGYATGPSLGYGEISVCLEDGAPFHGQSTPIPGWRCPTDPIPREEADQLQRAQDQKRGAFFFSLIGGSVGAIVARRLANDWLVILPPASVRGDESWSMELRLPLPAR